MEQEPKQNREQKPPITPTSLALGALSLAVIGGFEFGEAVKLVEAGVSVNDPTVAIRMYIGMATSGGGYACMRSAYEKIRNRR